MTLRRPELLAPAGDADSLTAALQAGADAVYFGLDEGMNARARARNFALAGLRETCDQIHRAGARAYLTMNTLVFERELDAVEAVLRQVAAAGVDALIVQDPAIALLARALAPTLEVHASTQMTISSPEAARFAQQLGVTRVVVPRELNLREIELFAQNCPLELEVFVHGALCVSWSGQCLTSEAWGGRSANRGQCAQSCRMPYSLVVDGEERGLGEVEYLLSPRDLAAVRALPELVRLGVHGLKIEGRQKGPQYVQTAVHGYQRWVDAIVAGQQAQRVPIARLQRDLADMALSYTRGFTDGFLGGSDHQQLVEGRFPKHRGMLLGTVAEITARGVRIVRSERTPTGGAALYDGAGPSGAIAVPLPDLAGADPVSAQGLAPADVAPRPGMGVGFDTGRPEADEPGGPLFAVHETPDGWWLGFGSGAQAVDLAQVRRGDRVWLTRDPLLARETEKLLQAQAPQGRIPVILQVKGAVGQPLQLVWTAQGPVGQGATVTQDSDQDLQPSSGVGLDEALLRDKLGGLGGTPFVLDQLDLTGLASGLHLPVSVLKSLRRQAVADLEQVVLARHRHAVAPDPVAPQLVADAAALHTRREWPQGQDPQLIPLVRTDAQLDAVIAAGLPEVVLDWMELVGLTRAVDKARAAGLRVVIATVRVQKPGEDGFDRRFERLQPDGVLVRHWGGLMHFAGLDTPPAVHGDFSLNVTNSVTAHHLWALGADTLTVAHDLDEAQVHHLLERVPAHRVEVIVHHHIATFHTEHCVYAHLLSHGRDFRSCGRPCEQHRVALRDHQGQQHPVVVDVGCRNTVFNAQAQSAAGAVARLLARGVRRFRVELVHEDYATTLDLLKGYKQLLHGELVASDLMHRVGVHEQFGVTAGTMRTFGV